MADNIDDIISKIKSNSNEENKKLAQELQSGLSESQNDALQKLMGDKEMLKKIFESERMKKIIDNLGGDKNGHK